MYWRDIRYCDQISHILSVCVIREGLVTLVSVIVLSHYTEIPASPGLMSQCEGGGE